MGGLAEFIDGIGMAFRYLGSILMGCKASAASIRAIVITSRSYKWVDPS